MGHQTTVGVEQWHWAGSGNERNQVDKGLLWLTLHRDQHLIAMFLLQR
jgi:hypothetical protein